MTLLCPSKAFFQPQAVRFGITAVVLKSIKADSKEFTAVKLFFIIKSRKILKIRRPKLIRI